MAAGRAVQLERVCSVLRTVAVPLAFRRLELGNAPRLLAIREAQYEAARGLAGRTRTLVIMGDCSAAAAWITRCSPLGVLELRHPLRATALSALKAMRQHPPRSLVLEIEPTSHGQRDAIVRIFDHVHDRPRIARIALSLRTRTTWTPDAFIAERLEVFDFACDDTHVMAVFLRHTHTIFDLRLRLLSEAAGSRLPLIVYPFGPHLSASTPAIDPTLRDMLLTVRRLTLTGSDASSSEIDLVLQAMPQLERLHLASSPGPRSQHAPSPSAYPFGIQAIVLDLPLVWHHFIGHVDGVLARRRRGEMDSLEVLRGGSRIWRWSVDLSSEGRIELIERAAAVGLRLELA